MPRIGFFGFSWGASMLNGSTLLLAVDQNFRVYVVYGVGGGQAIVLNSFRSVLTDGSTIPDRDSSNRPFPGNLEGKTVRCTVAPGFSVGREHGMSIAVQSLTGSQSMLYEWSGRLDMTSSCIGGYQIEGTAELYTSSPGNAVMCESDMYGNLMHRGTGAEDGLRRAIARRRTRTGRSTSR
jgi:hypothetical protein